MTNIFDLSGRGISQQDAKTMPFFTQASPTATVTTDSPNRPAVNWLWTLLAVFVFMVLLKIAVEHEKSGMQMSFVGVGVWNFVAVGTMAMFFHVVMKAIFNKWYIKGITDFVNV